MRTRRKEQMTIKQAYQILIEDYAYATEESKEALEVLVCAYDYLYKVDYCNFFENRKRINKSSSDDEIIDFRNEFVKKFEVDLTKLDGLNKED